ncbi:MAG: NUDIX domain-containing protein [Patescibacteria group bacterium]
MKKQRFKLTPASYLVLMKDDKVLLLRRHNTGYNDGNYSLVAGHLDGQETFRQAMVREAKEEAGISLNPDDLEIIHVMHRQENFTDVGKRERIDIFIKPNKWEGKPQNLEPDKCDDISWFPVNNLPENMVPCVKKALKYIHDKIFYSEFGF